MSKLTNKQRIEKVAKDTWLTMGCWDPKLELLSEKAIKQVLSAIPFEADCLVYIDRRKHVVEINIVDTELDLSVMTLADYEFNYGEWVE